MKYSVVAGVLLGDAGALVALRPDGARVAATLARPRAALTEHGADGALQPVVGAAAWVAAAWLAVGLGAALAGRLPGAAGRIAGVVAGRLLPRALLSVVSGSAGLGLLLAPAAAAAPVGAPSGPLPPAWPVTATSAGPASAPGTPSAPAWPTGGPAPSTSAHPTPDAAPPQTPQPATTPSTPAHRDRPAATSVTVRAGDSLWKIAERQVDPGATAQRIAREWPRWFAANRPVIGADPDLLHPGQTLEAPADHRPSDPSSPEAQR